jgi:hypothetical protein
MAEIKATADREIGAPARDVYRYISDFRQHHPRFLPPNFSNVKVEKGGVGKGTVVSFRLKAGMRERDYRMEIGEPERGRVMTESDTESSLVTRWSLSAEGKNTRVRIETTWEGAGGVGGFFERLFAPRVLRRLYLDELGRLDQYARQQRGG